MGGRRGLAPDGPARRRGGGEASGRGPAQRATPKDASADEGKRRRARERAVEEAEALVAKHEAELAALEASLADPALYGGADRGGISTLTAARDAERRKLDEAMAAWEAAIAALDR